MTVRSQRNDAERGAILVHVAFALIALLAFSTFVIDYGVFWLGRRQAQNAADAGALAGAIALAYDDYTDRTPTGPAQVNAQAAALRNGVFGAAPSVQLGTDITFPACPDDGTDSCIRVDVHRTTARSNPLPVLAGTFVGLTSQDVVASATAKAAGGNASDCLRPFAVPDLPYTLADHLGQTVEFRDDPGAATGPGWFRLLDLIGGGSGGASELWRTIRTCAADPHAIGETLIEETGVVGNLHTHINAMVALDDQAYVDPTTHQVLNSCADTRSCDQWVAGNGGNFTRVPDPGRFYSPRVVPIAVFDPVQYAANGQVVVTNIFGFFLLPAQGPPNFRLRGVIVSQPGLLQGGAGAVNPNATFLRIVLLIR
jgi:hypothetical protein